jgi:hypothetical protein
MAFGTAPHRIGGVWYTETGRRLSGPGQKYWEMHYKTGAADGRGHVNRAVGRATDTAKYGKTQAQRTAAGQQAGAAAQKAQGTPTGGVGSVLGKIGHTVAHAASGVEHAAAGGIEGLLPGTGWGAGGHRQKHGLGRSTSVAQEKAGKLAVDVGNVTLGPGLTKYATGTNTGLPSRSAAMDLAMLPLPFGKDAREAKRALEAGRAARSASHTERLVTNLAEQQKLAKRIEAGQKVSPEEVHKLTAEREAIIAERDAAGKVSRGAKKEANATHYGGEVGKKLYNVMGDARQAASEQKGVYRKEKGQRFQSIDSEFERAGGGAVGSRAARAAMAGEHTKVPWGGMQTVDAEARQFHTLLSKTRKAEARVERTHGPIPSELSARFSKEAFAGGKDWKEFSRLRGYTPEEIADYEKMSALSHKYPGLQPDIFEGGRATSSLRAVREHLARSGQRFTQNEVDDLHDLVYKHPNLDHKEKLQLWDALDRGTMGHSLQPSQIKLIEHAFGPQAAAHASKGQMAHMIGQLVNIPRSLMSTLDASFGMRQALPLAASHPKLWAKEYGGSFKYFGGKGGARRYSRDMSAIEKHQNFDMWKEAGVNFTDVGRKMGHREEAFPSPIAEKLTGGDRSPIRMSSRAYTGAANRLRITYAEHLLEKAQKQGYKNTVKLREDIARLVNAHTGRGSLPGSLEKAGPALNTVFFSPRLFASRIETVALAGHKGLHPFVRREAQGSVAKIAGGVGAVTAGAAAAGAKVETDPRNADFGKVKLGNTRVDPWAGFQQPVRAASQIASGKIISSTTGKTLRLSGGNAPSPLERFVESKLSPQAGIVMDVAHRKTFLGDPITLKGEAKSHLIPLGAQDAYQVTKDTHSIAKGAGALALSSVGVGVQNYSAKSKKKHHSAVQPRDSHGRFATATKHSFARASGGRAFATGGTGEDHPAAATHSGGRRFAQGG